MTDKALFILWTMVSAVMVAALWVVGPALKRREKRKRRRSRSPEPDAELRQLMGDYPGGPLVIDQDADG